MNKNLFYLFLVVFFLAACQKREETTPIENPNTKVSNNTQDEGPMVLGKKLENPYSVKNMRIAYKRLMGKKNYSVKTSATDENAVTTTHYYVRFLPKDTAEYDRLKTDTTLHLYQIPLDYEIISSGSNYQDTTGKPTWQYTAVKKGYQFDPNIQYEILEELYIPETVEATTTSALGSNKSNPNQFTIDLVNESMKLTNNLKDTLKSTNDIKTLYRPSGRIRVFDTRLNAYIPLVGVQIRGRRWFNFQRTYTDANGNYSLGYFGGNTNLSIFYETNDFDVRSGTFGQAWLDGPHTNDPWSVDISGGVQRFYAHVFRGARRYHHGDIGGLNRPDKPYNIKYAAYDKRGSSQGMNVMVHIVWPDISIWRYKSNGEEYSSDEIFSTAVHETAHSSHLTRMNSGLIQYAQVSSKLIESWAVGVEWMITQKEYRERGITNYSGPEYDRTGTISYPISRAYQYWNRNFNDPNYTPLYIDLIDDYNQASTGIGSITDNVRGYTLPQIEGFLKHIYGLSSLNEQLKAHKPVGVTDAQIDQLLGQY